MRCFADRLGAEDPRAERQAAEVGGHDSGDCVAVTPENIVEQSSPDDLIREAGSAGDEKGRIGEGVPRSSHSDLMKQLSRTSNDKDGSREQSESDRNGGTGSYGISSHPVADFARFAANRKNKHRHHLKAPVSSSYRRGDRWCPYNGGPRTTQTDGVKAGWHGRHPWWATSCTYCLTCSLGDLLFVSGVEPRRGIDDPRCSLGLATQWE